MFLKHLLIPNILDVKIEAVVVVDGVVVVVVVGTVVVVPIFVKTLYIKEVTRVVPNMSCNENPCVTSDCLLVFGQEIGQTSLPLL